MLRALVIAAVLASTARAVAAEGTVSVTLNQLGMDIANQIGASVPELTANAQQKIDSLFQLSGLPHLLGSFANTGAFAVRGLGVDYQPDAGDVIMGVVVDGALASDAGLSTDRPLSATVINYAVNGGVNLARWGQPRLTVFASGSYAATTIRGMSGELLAAGAHLQYKLVRPSAPGNARWTGLDVTSGLEYAHWSIGLASSLETHIVITGSTGEEYVHMSCTGTLSVLAETLTLPVEVSTGVRFLDVFGFYAGAGADLTTGSSTIDAVLDAVLSINAARMEIGTAHITASGSSGPSTATVHAFGGLEIHTRHVRVYAQGAVAPDERSLAFGVRGVF